MFRPVLAQVALLQHVSVIIEINLVWLMSIKFAYIFLSLLFLISVKAKPAPENTFRLDTKTPPPLLDANIAKSQSKDLQDKIDDLKSRKKENLFVDNFNNLKLYYLETNLKLQSEDLN
jgi:hypothetical protein